MELKRLIQILEWREYLEMNLNIAKLMVGLLIPKKIKKK